MKYRAGDWVEVRSEREILATLDSKGEIDGMPFMPEMLQFCGRRLRVGAVAHKTCDTANKTGGRRVPNTLHLEGVRCDGTAHGGCQAGCLLFWKTDWVVPARSGTSAAPTVASGAADEVATSTLHSHVARLEGGETIYRCQATQLYSASQPLPWWDVRQYVLDLWYRNVSLARLTRVLLLRTLYHLRRIGLGYRATIAIHDFTHRLLTGRPTPYPEGLIPVGQPTPVESLGLVAGEWVKVKSLDEIRGTITEHNLNRGMRFDPEMAQYCERQFKVERRVERLIDERTGKMLVMKSPCIVLDGVVCAADYTAKRLFCPRQIHAYYREIWLRRQQ
jgi:hypothetical protein